ncbi:MAG: DNA-processing protein DprA [Desulfosoma sp.]
MEISANTQAVLLLTVHLAGTGAGRFSPLTPKEWGRFAAWLKARGRSPQDLLHHDLQEILEGWEDNKITPQRLENLLRRGAALALSLEKWSRAGLWILTRSDPDYPACLKKLLKQDCPPLFFGCGNKELLNRRSMAVVGSRDADEAALGFAAKVGSTAAERGFVIVSGGARGVDEAAMLGALDRGGRALGVLANGLLKAVSSVKYRSHLMDGTLTLITPYHPEVGFSVGQAMQRNRYIYCLSEVAVVVQSGDEGGTWNGALENLRHGWVPLWVRKTADPGGAHEKIVSKGAEWLPDDLGQWFDSLKKRTPPEEAPPPTAPESTEPPTEGLSCYELFLTQAAIFCREPRTVEEMCGKWHLPKVQVDAWTSRAVDEGLLTKLTRPARYLVPEHRDQTASQWPGHIKEDLTFYDLFLSRLPTVLNQEKTEKELQEAFDVRMVTLRRWLKRAVEEEAIVRKESPVRYTKAIGKQLKIPRLK